MFDAQCTASRITRAAPSPAAAAIAILRIIGATANITTSDPEKIVRHPQPERRRPPTAPEITSWCVCATVLVLVLWIRLLPALLAGLLVYELVHVMAPLLQRLLRVQPPLPQRAGGE